MINLVLDTETSGLGDNAGICDIAMLVIDDSLNVLKEYTSLIDPEVAIEPGAYATHGISDADVFNSPTASEYFRFILKNEFDSQPVRVVAHNAAFDLRFVQDYLCVQDVLCTMHLARRLFPMREKHKLEILQAELGLVATGKAHSALADTYTCLDLVRRMCNMLGTDLAGLRRYWDEPYDYSVMTWGKHHSKPLHKIPSHYRSWLNSLKDLDPQLRAHLEAL